MGSRKTEANENAKQEWKLFRTYKEKHKLIYVKAF
jgi:hypothetical protein